MNQINGWIGRRDLLRLAGIGGASLLGAVVGLGSREAAALAAGVSATAPSSSDAEAALQQLLDGNQRFVQHKPQYPHQSAKRLQEVAQSLPSLCHDPQLCGFAGSC
ncbi:hypothetical protein K9N68_29435 [Kovacikia minuta CCNUW1]|uniref:hypothetical protein n=1 Tax=Kovacikia minuta TaxID=2931930 RepID=UPI001CCBC595|nr:hypothetical protein K9N68_29435 [Kovacikia minuta CCNUW1]